MTTHSLVFGCFDVKCNRALVNDNFFLVDNFDLFVQLQWTTTASHCFSLFVHCLWTCLPNDLRQTNHNGTSQRMSLVFYILSIYWMLQHINICSGIQLKFDSTQIKTNFTSPASIAFSPHSFSLSLFTLTHEECNLTVSFEVGHDSWGCASLAYMAWHSIDNLWHTVLFSKKSVVVQASSFIYSWCIGWESISLFWF